MLYMKENNNEFSLETPERVPLQIARFLRNQIQAGIYKPGQMLPATDDLVRQWKIGRVSVHRALASLASEGLIERRRHKGTFVSAPDSRGIIGVVIGPDLADDGAHFCRAIIRAIQSEIERRKDCRWICRVYSGMIAGRSGQSVKDSPGYRELACDIQNYSFKGMIQIIGDMTSKQVAGLGLNLPTVRMGPSLDGTDADVILDHYRFGEECVKYIAEQGLKKIVYLRARFHTQGLLPDLEGVCRTAGKLGLPKVLVCQLRPELPSGFWLERAAYSKTLELIAAWKQKRDWPEVLLVPDDIAMKGVALALVRERGKVPGQLLAITMANEGIHHHYGVPVVRYENSPADVAAALFDILWKRIANIKLPLLPVKIAGQFQTQKSMLGVA